MAATLRLTREGAGIELRRGQFEAWVDGGTSGTIDYAGTFVTQVEPGQHTLQIRRGRYSSQSHPFDATDGEVVSFRCHGAMLWPRWVASLVKPHLAISLRRE
ncbi:MAG TPA: hypothetical protein VGM53_10375 [Streptosporangiaceae bacterium]|jgi:hypothetical protein